ncbi:uncharacterized protein [Drosophila virilis]|uniref:Uncharacterized protein n=1 Tax=Drosophila virilis TaxID=7244 RepID=B4M6T8_DROVI|nr:uncharacterized protein LOC6633734 [Drosophila virilis]EDW62505.1 uncharacterized protein Dvir_GJ16577 [Drosophila virilis]
MPLGRKLAIGSEEARRQRAELRTSYGNKLSNMNLGRMRSRSNPANTDANPFQSTTLAMTSNAASSTSSLRRIASSFAHVSDLDCGRCAALPHEDSEEDAREERAEVLIRSEPFKSIAGTAGATAASPTTTTAAAAQSSRASASPNATASGERRNHYLCADVMQSRASERWGQIAGTVSTLFRVRRISTANPLSELRRLREQRDLLEAFTRPFLYEDNVQRK